MRNRSRVAWPQCSTRPGADQTRRRRAGRPAYTAIVDHAPSPAPPPLSLYLHVPFCTVKCAYCDFNSYPDLEGAIPAWEAALLRELRLWAPRLTGRPVPTVFFGGGTPSLLEGASVARLLDAVRDAYALAPDAEISLEANPESMRPERLAAYRAAGVNRLSMGVQSLDADELRFLDRLHSAERAAAAYREAREAGFPNISCDLIYGLPGQPLTRWQATLEAVAGWGPEHLSCYALTVEEETPLALRVARGEVAEPDPDLQASMADWTEDFLAATGYAQYEISNYARPGFEARHNLVYWRQTDYLGLGPGAHGFVDGVRYAVERSPLRYIRALTPDSVRPAPAARPSTGSGRTARDLPSPAIVSREDPDPATLAVDAVTMGLRLNAGIDVGAFTARYGAPFAAMAPAFAWGEAQGLLSREGSTLRFTRRGRRLANEVLVRVLSAVAKPAARRR